jgi:hypothetical protein
MVFAQAEELDVLHDYHCIVLYLEQSVIDDSMDVRPVAAGKKPESFVRSFGGPDQPITLRILLQSFQEFSDQRRKGMPGRS